MVQCRHPLRLGLIVAILIAVIPVETRASDTSSPPMRVIGLLLPPEEALRDSIREGVTLGAAQASSDIGSPVQVVIRERASHWGGDAVEAAGLVTEDGALALIAPPEGAATHLVLQVAGRTGVPVASLCPDASVSQAGIPWAVRVVPKTADEVEALFRHLNNPERSWTMLIPETRAGREIQRDAQRAAKELSQGPGSFVFLSADGGEMDELCQQILGQDPGLVLLWLDPHPAGTIVRALRDRGYSGALAVPMRVHTCAFLDAAGDAARGVLHPILPQDARAEHARFVTAYQERFGHPPDALAAMGYDAARFLLHAIDQAGESPSRQPLPRTALCPGATGTLQFDSFGNRQTQLSVDVLAFQPDQVQSSSPKLFE